MSNAMKITVMGPGGVGGYFGARLAAAGSDVTFVARGSHLEAMQTRGLRLDSEIGPLHLEKVKVVADAREIAGGRCRDLRGQDARHRDGRGKPARAGRQGRDGLHVPERRRERGPCRRGAGCGQGGAGHGAHRLVDLGAGRDQADRHVRAAGFRRARRQAKRAHDRIPRSVQGGRHRCAHLREYPARAVDEVRHAGSGRGDDGADARADRAGARQCADAGAAAVGRRGGGGGRHGAEDGARHRGCGQDHASWSMACRSR